MSMLRRGPLFALLAVLLACGENGLPPRRIVLVTLDTTRADHLGPYGYAAARTPVLDAFARRSTVYGRAYATSSWTVPSHASILTGLLPVEHGAVCGVTTGGVATAVGSDIRPLQDRFTTLAEQLRDAGYRTGAVVAAPTLRRALGMAQGFEVYVDEIGNVEDRRTGTRAESITDRAMEILEDFGEEPAFLFVNFYDPHAPYRPPPPHDSGLPPREELERAAEIGNRMVAGKVGRGSRDVRRSLDLLREAYDAEIAYMDAHLGRLLESLEPWRDTLIVITADHGESFGEHATLGHGVHLYEDNIRVPLIVRWPGGRDAGTRIETPVQNHQVFASILEVAGVPLPAGVTTPNLGVTPGELLAHLTRSQLTVAVYGERFDRTLHGLVVPPLKLIASSRGRAQLFDVEADPGELEDLATRRPEDVVRLRSRLDRVLAMRVARYDPALSSDLDQETEAALRELGYIE